MTEHTEATENVNLALSPQKLGSIDSWWKDIDK